MSGSFARKLVETFKFEADVVRVVSNFEALSSAYKNLYRMGADEKSNRVISSSANCKHLTIPFRFFEAWNLAENVHVRNIIDGKNAANAVYNTQVLRSTYNCIGTCTLYNVYNVHTFHYRRIYS